ncbi:hypothetical protein [Dietzia kunjamensis]|uniref:hypothetical protein n=1 Tax=Dietzia kunjamensis TaxID=322509 RepID=UPI003368BB94
MAVFVAGGVVVLAGAADTVGTAVVTEVVRRVVLVVAAVLVPAVVDSSSPDGFGGAEVVVSDAVEFSSGEVRVVVGGSLRAFPMGSWAVCADCELGRELGARAEGTGGWVTVSSRPLAGGIVEA